VNEIVKFLNASVAQRLSLSFKMWMRSWVHGPGPLVLGPYVHMSVCPYSPGPGAGIMHEVVIIRANSIENFRA